MEEELEQDLKDLKNILNDFVEESTMYQSYIKEIKAVSDLIIKTQEKLDRLRDITRIREDSIKQMNMGQLEKVIYKVFWDKSNK